MTASLDSVPPPANMYGFTLAPGDTLTITGLASVQAASDGGSMGATYWQNDHSNADVVISISTLDGPNPDVTSDLYISTPWNAPSNLAQSRQLTAEYTNTSDQAVHGTFYMQSSAIVFAVPEPDSRLLLAGGAGLVAWSLTRRRGDSTRA